MKGKVKFFNQQKRFGFVAGDDNKEYFVHESGLNEGVRISEDDVVEFDVEEGDRGPKAVNVKKAKAGSEEETEDSEEDFDDESEEESDEEEPKEDSE
ncbi:MAG: cold shock domain-containing protein [Candidatus Woesearchaeota archaeon]